MTYELAIGDRGYSSWSLRGWLMFERFGIPVKTRFTRLYTNEVQTVLSDFYPSKTLPAVKTPEGTIIGESIAIAEELASRHPDAGLWPTDPAHRAKARSLAAEMHAGFTALRSFCPMNIRVAYSGVEVPDDVTRDLRRLELIWEDARETTGSAGPWLCGDYSLAYVDAHLADPAFRRWRAMGLVDGPDQPNYYRDYATRDWPGPKPLPARAVESGPSVNETCPYSGKPVTHFLELGGETYGFCNAFCRDKTMADPEAWPKFMAVYQS